MDIAKKSWRGIKQITKNVLKIKPNNSSNESPEFYNSLARLLLSQTKLEKALEAVNKALNLAPNYAEAHFVLASIYMAQHELASAIRSAESAIAIAPNYAEPYYLLARCLRSRNKIDEAILNAKTAIKLVPEYTEVYFFLGENFYRLKQLEEAVTYLEKALTLKPDYVEAMNQLALVFQDSGRLNDAEILYRQAISLKSDYANAHNNLGFLLRQLGRSKEAIASFKIAHALANPELVLSPPAEGVKNKLNLAKRYLRVSTDIARWKLTKTLRPNAWKDCQLLNQATNGASNEHFSIVLKKFAKKPKPSSEWRTSPIFPWVQPQDVPKILDTLDRDGVYVFDQLISPEVLEPMVDFAKTTKADLSPPLPYSSSREIFNPEAPLSSGYYFDHVEMLQHPVFQQFLGDPLIFNLAQSHFGVEPRNRELTLWWSPVFDRIPSSYLAQLYHSDLSCLKWLMFFVYLTDVTESTGPHTYVLGSHKPDQEGKEFRQRGVVRISDEEMEAAYGKERILNIIGSKGTAFIADTRGFHKGNRPQSGHRLMIQNWMVNSLYPLTPMKKPLSPIDPTLIETLRQHPKMFEGYNIKDA